MLGLAYHTIVFSHVYVIEIPLVPRRRSKQGSFTLWGGKESKQGKGGLA